MNTKEIKINIPEGYEIDKEKSTFECIKFKKKETIPWRETEGQDIFIKGYYLHRGETCISCTMRTKENRDIFATEKQAKSALAMAQISQIMANDERFGGIVTDEEWLVNDYWKAVIRRGRMGICIGESCYDYEFLAFHTKEQRDLFLKENMDLIKDYLMIN